MGEKRLIDIEENITPSGLGHLVDTGAQFIIPQAVTRLREIREKYWSLEDSTSEMTESISRLETALASARQRLVTYETQIAQMSQPRSKPMDDLNIPVRFEKRFNPREKDAASPEIIFSNEGPTCARQLRTIPSARPMLNERNMEFGGDANELLHGICEGHPAECA